jgi:TRAP-type uncharacterized transport system substrate-binding protein
MFFEPFWFFSRVPPGVHLEGLRGKRISIGPEGSGTRAFVIQFMAMNGIHKRFAEWRSVSVEEAVRRCCMETLMLR